jgi:hypothetical protein
MTGTDTLTTPERSLDTYLLAHRDGAEFVAATESWTTAAPYITATGQAFLPMGGFSGSVPEPTLARIKQLVAQGDLRFFLLSGSGTGQTGGFGAGGGFGGSGTGTGSTVSSIASWVTSSCTEISASAYGGSSGQSLYQCASTS